MKCKINGVEYQHSLIKLFKRYWVIASQYSASHAEGMVYFALLEIFNRYGWESSLRISNAELSVRSKVSLRSISDLRMKLARKGLIAFRKGKRNSEYPEYTLPLENDGDWHLLWKTEYEDNEATKELSVSSGSSADTSSDTSSGISSDTSSDTFADTSSGTSSDTSAAYNKTNTKTKEKTKIKTKSSSLGSVTGTVAQGTACNATHAEKDKKFLSEGNDIAPQCQVSETGKEVAPGGRRQKVEEPAQRNKPAPSSRIGRSGPSLKEVTDYFLSQGKGRLGDCEASACRFFDYFEAVGWRDKYKRRLTAWQSRANSWIDGDVSKENAAKSKGGNYCAEHGHPDCLPPVGGFGNKGYVTPDCGRIPPSKDQKFLTPEELVKLINK